METLFTDLDSTIVFSHRREVDVPIRWVEMLEGRRQSYMTERSYSFFKSQNALDVVPVSTRTVEQYRRLQPEFDLFGWRHALVCNGAVLMIDGEIDQEWVIESNSIAQNDMTAMMEVQRIVRSMYEPEQIAFAEPYLFYVKAGEENVESLYKQLRQQTDPNHITIHKDSRKVYAVPRALCKGAAIKRYRERFSCDYIIAAGDSSFDVSLLEVADLCFCPASLLPEVNGKGEIIACTDLLSDGICDGLENFINKGSYS